MSFQEKNNLVSLACAVFIFGAYYAYMGNLYMTGGFDGDNALALVGQYTLILIIASIIVNIIATILFNILFAIATNDASPEFVTDERDEQIELKGQQISSYVTGAGFVLSMGALAMEVAPFLVFNAIVLSFAGGAVASNLLKLCLYRKGQ